MSPDFALGSIDCGFERLCVRCFSLEEWRSIGTAARCWSRTSPTLLKRSPIRFARQPIVVSSSWDGQSAYLADSNLSKEDLARQLAQRDGVRSGPICLFACVEPCLSFQLRGDRQAKQLRLVLEHSKCTHLYHYYQHAQFGQLHVRVQTWFPFSIDVCLNGRQWLARQMDQAGIAYHQRDNCFVWIEDWQKARQLSEQQLRRDWASLLNSLLS
jgi:hypothetical protein